MKPDESCIAKVMGGQANMVISCVTPCDYLPKIYDSRKFYILLTFHFLRLINIKSC